MGRLMISGAVGIARGLLRVVLGGLALSGCVRLPTPGPGADAPPHHVELRCLAGDDADRDGLSDECEWGLARAFAPMLLVDPKDCVVDAGSGQLRGGYLHVVGPRTGGARIAYLPAYERDCGWSGVACWFRGAQCSGHAGDSEILAIDVERDGDRWRPTGLFLSAHCGGRAAASCRWYRGADLNAIVWEGGAADIWVARDKHANYPTRDACEVGHWRQERCGSRPTRMRFPVEAAGQNLGARSASPYGPGGCIAGRQRPRQPTASSAIECFWSDSAFGGWLGEPRSAATRSYLDLLAELGFDAAE